MPEAACWVLLLCAFYWVRLLARSAAPRLSTRYCAVSGGLAFIRYGDFTTLRRILRKKAPRLADRGHIHHLMQDLGFSDRRALVLIVAMSVSLNFLGLMLHRSIVAEYHQFAIFCGCFALYCLLTSQAWRVAEK